MFEVKVNGVKVHEIDVDPQLVEAVTIAGQRIPVKFDAVELDVIVEFKSLRDGELIERQQREAQNEWEEEVGQPQAPITEEEMEAREKFAASLSDPSKRETQEKEVEDDSEGLDNSGSDSGNSGFDSGLRLG